MSLFLLADPTRGGRSPVPHHATDFEQFMPRGWSIAAGDTIGKVGAGKSVHTSSIGVMYRSCPRMAVRKSNIHFFPTIPARNSWLFDWFVVGDKENRERSPAEKPASALSANITLLHHGRFARSAPNPRTACQQSFRGPLVVGAEKRLAGHAEAPGANLDFPAARKPGR